VNYSFVSSLKDVVRTALRGQSAEKLAFPATAARELAVQLLCSGGIHPGIRKNEGTLSVLRKLLASERILEDSINPAAIRPNEGQKSFEGNRRAPRVSDDSFFARLRFQPLRDSA